MSLQRRFADGVQMLATHGLNLVAVLDKARAQLDVLAQPSARLVLIGNGGSAFWQAFISSGTRGDHPVDAFSRKLAVRFAEEYLQTPALVLYPGPSQLPLQQLGALAGWHHPSPLGIGIHPEYGLWFAYRAVLLVHADLPSSRPVQDTSPCTDCQDRPCLQACPAQALAEPGKPDVDRCLSWRLQTESSCARSCLARLACPVGIKHRYTDEQIQYHYGHSLVTLGSCFKNSF